MKYGKEDLGYLKMELIRDIVGFIGMVIMFFIGLTKNLSPLCVVSVLIGGFIGFQMVKTIVLIYRIEKDKK